MAPWNMAGRIRGALRQIFRMSPEHKAILQAARVETAKHRKDGTQAKRPDVSYQCASCKGLFKPKDIEVDHINGLPSSPGTRNAAPNQTWDNLIEEMFYGPMQVLCKTCHKFKTKRQRKEG